MRQRTYRILNLATICWLLIAPGLSAAQPSQGMLPASTKFSLSVRNQQELNDLLATTELGKLLQDPALKPFLDDLPRQMRNEASKHPLGALWIDLGVESGDLKDLSEGEVAWALVQSKGEKPARVFIADIAKRKKQADALLEKIAASMRKQKAKKSDTKLGSATLTAFDIPAAGKVAARKLVSFQQDDRLVFTESTAVAQVLLKNLGGESADSLAKQAGYQQVVKQCQERAGDEMPDAVLFLVPVDLSDSLRQLSPKQDKRAADSLAIARKHNFDAISAVGGFITVGRGPYDFHLRIAVYAPQPWKNGMRVCKFPNGQLALPDWVHGDNSGYTMLNIDFAQVGKYLGPLFDDVYGQGEEGLYDDLKNTLREDPDGPQIDIDKEVYARLSPQTTLLARDALPVTPDSAQRLIALSTKEEAALKAVVKKIFEADPNAEAKKIAGREAYFSYAKEESEGVGAPAAEGQKKTLSFITCVANGHLILATDVKILEAVLGKGGPMAEDSDHKAVTPHLDHLGGEICLQHFGRLRDGLRTDYELFRQGKKPNAGKSFKGLLNNIAAGEPPEIEEPDFDGSKLPPFDEVEKYLGSAGLVGIATNDGWFLEGFVLKKPQ